MECKSSSTLIMAYVDEIITDEEWARLQKHMEICKNCREEFKLFTEMLTTIEEIPLDSPTENFEDRIMMTIDHNLYANTAKKRFQLSPVIFAIGIYLTYMYSVLQRGAEIGLGGWEINTVKILQTISVLGGLMNRVIQPQRMFQYMISIFSFNRFNFIVAYTLGLFILLLLLTKIRAVLMGLLENEWRRV